MHDVLSGSECRRRWRIAVRSPPLSACARCSPAVRTTHCIHIDCTPLRTRRHHCCHLSASTAATRRHLLSQPPPMWRTAAVCRRPSATASSLVCALPTRIAAGECRQLTQLLLNWLRSIDMRMAADRKLPISVLSLSLPLPLSVNRRVRCTPAAAAAPQLCSMRQLLARASATAAATYTDCGAATVFRRHRRCRRCGCRTIR